MTIRGAVFATTAFLGVNNPCMPILLFSRRRCAHVRERPAQDSEQSPLAPLSRATLLRAERSNLDVVLRIADRTSLAEQSAEYASSHIDSIGPISTVLPCDIMIM